MVLDARYLGLEIIPRAQKIDGCRQAAGRPEMRRKSRVSQEPD